MKNLQRRTERGVALVLSVLFLLIMTIVGLSLVGGTILQERMGSNHMLQAMGFEAASAGIAEALSFGLTRDNWQKDPDGNPLPCRRGENNWIGPWGGAGAGAQNGGWRPHLTRTDIRSEYRLVVYCREDDDWAESLLEEGFDRVQLPPQLFVVSEGRVLSVERGDTLSTRQIEVRVEDIAGSFANVDPAIRIEGNPVEYSGAGGNFVVDGAGGPSISTDGAPNQEAIRDAIKDQFIGNYGGEEGIADSVGNPPFDSPAALREWVLAIKGALQATPQSCVGNFVLGNARSGGNKPDCDSSDYKSLDDPIEFPEGWDTGALTYITGDLTVGPNAIAAGSGLVIVEGKVCWHGNSSFEGKIIALGGLYQMSGGGSVESAGTTEGSIFVADLDLNNPTSGWGSSALEVAGGGGHLVAYDCLADRAQWQQLYTCGLAEPWAEPACLDDGSRAPGLGARKWMTSWRENLGWREGIFVDN